MNKKYIYLGLIGTILIVSVALGVTLTTTDYRQLLNDNPNMSYIMLTYSQNNKVEFLTRGLTDFLRWKIDKDKLTLYSGKSIGVQSDWIVEYWKTYGNDEWVKLNRKANQINLSYIPIENTSITVMKKILYYSSAYSGNGGKLNENFTVASKATYYNFPDEYSVSWVPDKSRENSTHKLTWRLTDLDPLLNTPSGIIRNVYSLNFGHDIKVDWSTAKEQFDFAEYNSITKTLLVHFLPAKGEQIIDVRATDPTDVILLVYLNDYLSNKIYELNQNASIYVELVNSTLTSYKNVPLENTAIAWYGTNSPWRLRTEITIPDNVFNCTAQVVLESTGTPDGNLTVTIGNFTNETALQPEEVTGSNVVYNFSLPDTNLLNDTALNITLYCQNCSGSLYDYDWSYNNTLGGHSWRSSDNGSTWSFLSGRNFVANMLCSKKTNIDETIYLSLNHPTLGTNFTSGISPLTYTWNNVNSSTIIFSDGNSSKNVTSNSTLTYSAETRDKFINATFNIFGEIDVLNLFIDIGRDGNVDYSINKVRNGTGVIDNDSVSAKNITIFGYASTNATAITIAGNQTYSVGKINITGYNKSAAIVGTITVPSNKLYSLAAAGQYLYAGEIANYGVSNGQLFRIRILDSAITANETRCFLGGCSGLGIVPASSYLYTLWNETTGDWVTRYNSVDLSSQTAMLPSGVIDAQGLDAVTNDSIWIGGYATGENTIISSNVTMYGTHYYNSFQVTNGVWITVADKNATEGTGYLKIYANDNITLCSTCKIDGNGKGYSGGAGGSPGGDVGDDGQGSLNGSGGQSGSGGAGGASYGYGGNGTNALAKAGYANYTFLIGSGGGGGYGFGAEAGGNGGDGGAAVLLSSKLIWLNGVIDLSGSNGQTHDLSNEGGGGGGAGGHLELWVNNLTLEDALTINVKGGNGGAGGNGGLSDSGGGGGGLFIFKHNTGYAESSFYTITYSGGDQGSLGGGGTDGGTGAFSENQNSDYGYSGATLWNFYWNGTQIQKFDADSALPIFNTSMDIQGIAYDSTNDVLWIADAYHGKIWAMGTDGYETTSLSFNSPVLNMRGLAWTEEYLYVLNATAIYKISPKGFPDEVKVDIGNDGVWDYEGLSFGESTITVNNVTAIQNYVNSYCTPSSCELPTKIYSGNPGIFEIKFGNTAYLAYSLSSLNMNTTAIENYLNSLGTSELTTFPINFNASSWGKLIVNNTIIYFNGTSNYTVTANYYGPTYNPTSDTNLLDVIWSNFNITQPYSYMEFIPNNLSDKNVQPYGQNSTIPFLNITAKGYTLPQNISIKLNQSLPSCANLSIGNSSAVGGTLLLTNSLQEFAWNLGYNDSISGHLWLNLTNCNRSITKSLTNIKIQLYSCGINCVSCW